MNAISVIIISVYVNEYVKVMERGVILHQNVKLDVS